MGRAGFVQRDPHRQAAAEMPSPAQVHHPMPAGMERDPRDKTRRACSCAGCRLLRGAVGTVAPLGREGPNHRVMARRRDVAAPCGRSRWDPRSAVSPEESPGHPLSCIFGTRRHAFPRVSWNKARRGARKVQTEALRQRGGRKDDSPYKGFYIQHPWETFAQGERTRDASRPFMSLYTAHSNAG